MQPCDRKRGGLLSALLLSHWIALRHPLELCCMLPDFPLFFAVSLCQTVDLHSRRRRVIQYFLNGDGLRRPLTAFATVFTVFTIWTCACTNRAARKGTIIHVPLANVILKGLKKELPFFRLPYACTNHLVTPHSFSSSPFQFSIRHYPLFSLPRFSERL